MIVSGEQKVPPIAAAVLDHNGSPDTISAIRSVLGSTIGVDVFLLINGSGTDHVAALHDALGDDKRVRIFTSSVNVGFAGGANLLADYMAQEARAWRYVLFLNSDARVERETLAILVRCLEGDCSVAVVGPRVFRDEYSCIIDDDGADALEFIFQHRARNAGVRCEGAAFEPPREVPFVAGTCALVRWKLFRDLGGFDRRLFAYFEDWDFGLRARAAGFRCMHVSEAVAWHRGATTLGRSSLSYQFLMTRNRWLVAKRHLHWRGFWLLFFPYFVISRIVAKTLLLLMQGQIGGARGILLAVLWLFACGKQRARIWPIPNSVVSGAA